MSAAAEVAQTLATPPPAKPGRERFDRLISAGTTVALVAVLMVLFAAMIVPALTGRTAMTVMTGSMAPSLPPGHVAIFSPVDPSTLVPGDVIVYQPDSDITGGIPITHRIIAVNPAADRTITQGDAVPFPDSPISGGQVIGKMDYYVPFAGILKVLIFHAGLDSATPLVVAGLMLYLLWLMASSALQRMRAPRSAGPELEEQVDRPAQNKS